jgi:small-conductance mechanosensitive channel
MQLTGKADRQFRYRAYFWLMNASSAAILYSFIELALARLTGFDPEDHVPQLVIGIFYGLAAIFMFFVPMFLICARFMRDEYAEQLWRRTAVVLAYATAAIPLVCFILAWGWYFATGHTDAKQVHWTLRWLADDIKWGDALMIVWLGYMMVFVMLFQILRWRDSR